MNTTDTINTLQIGSIVISLFGGLALFLFGMDQMTDALRMIASGRMKQVLAKLTTNRFSAVFAGALVTAVIQSSSVTTVLVVGFISAGLLTLAQSIGIIMGANIGTTITAQIIAFKVTKFALVLIVAGFGIQFLTKKKRIRQYGLIFLGLGLIFFGMEMMSDATRPLRTYQPFIDFMQQLDNPLLGIFIGAVFTGLIQSSSATTGIIIALASQGFITLELGIAMAFGANIGTCITVLLASIGKPREAVLAAMVHVLFNILGVIIWFGFIDELAALVRWLSPVVPLEGMAKLAAETPRQIANAHSIFNIANTVLFIWFTVPLAWLVQRLVPKKQVAESVLIQPKYLDHIFLKTPELALDCVRLELDRLGRYALQMVGEVLPTVTHGSEEDLDALAQMDDKVDASYGSIVTYLGLLSREDLLQSQSEQLADYMAIANDIENIGDMIQTNLVEAGRGRLEHNVEISEETEEVLKSLHNEVYRAVEQSLEALSVSDKRMAKEVRKAKPEINRLVAEADDHLSRRLTAKEPNRLDTFRIESEIIEYLKRVYYFAKRIARVIPKVDQTDKAHRKRKLEQMKSEILA